MHGTYNVKLTVSHYIKCPGNLSIVLFLYILSCFCTYCLLSVHTVLFLYILSCFCTYCLVSVHDTYDDQTISLLAVNNRLTYSYDYAFKEKDGVRFHATKNPKAVVEPSNAQYSFTNLFNGDKLLGKVPCIMHTELATSAIYRYTRHFCQ